MLAVRFVVACAAGIVASAALGRPVSAVKALLLLCLAPPAYFLVYGSLTGGVVFARFRALAFGMRPFDWLMILGGGILFLGTVHLFGLLVICVKLSMLAALLGFYLWAVDRPRAGGGAARAADATVGSCAGCSAVRG